MRTDGVTVSGWKRTVFMPRRRVAASMACMGDMSRPEDTTYLLFQQRAKRQQATAQGQNNYAPAPKADCSRVSRPIFRWPLAAGAVNRGRSGRAMHDPAPHYAISNADAWRVLSTRRSVAFPPTAHRHCSSRAPRPTPSPHCDTMVLTETHHDELIFAVDLMEEERAFAAGSTRLPLTRRQRPRARPCTALAEEEPEARTAGLGGWRMRDRGGFLTMCRSCCASLAS